VGLQCIIYKPKEPYVDLYAKKLKYVSAFTLWKQNRVLGIPILDLSMKVNGRGPYAEDINNHINDDTISMESSWQDSFSDAHKRFISENNKITAPVLTKYLKQV